MVLKDTETSLLNHITLTIVEGFLSRIVYSPPYDSGGLGSRAVGIAESSAPCAAHSSIRRIARDLSQGSLISTILASKSLRAILSVL